MKHIDLPRKLRLLQEGVASEAADYIEELLSETKTLCILINKADEEGHWESDRWCVPDSLIDAIDNQANKLREYI